MVLQCLRQALSLLNKAVNLLRLSLFATGRAAHRLLRCSHRHCPPRPRPLQHGRIVFHKAVIDNQTTIMGDIESMLLTDTQEVDLAIKPIDKKGQAAQVDGVPVWVSSDPSVIEITPAADGLSCLAKAGNIGSAQVSVSADADLGEGVVTITGVLDFNVVAGQAVSLSVIAGVPREQA
jgi:hypothetical protein